MNSQENLSIVVNTEGKVDIANVVSKTRVPGVSSHLISRYKTNPMSVLDSIQKEANISNQDMANLIENINDSIFNLESSDSFNETSEHALEILNAEKEK